jgi:hypothetical protein
MTPVHLSRQRGNWLHRPPRRSACLVLLVLGVLLPSAAASAGEPLTVTLTPSAGLQALAMGTITAEGSVVAPTSVTVLAEPGAAACAASLEAESMRPTVETVGEKFIEAGLFKAELPWVPMGAGSYRLCAYLSDLTPPYLAGESLATVAARPSSGGEQPGGGTPGGGLPAGELPKGGVPIGGLSDPTGVMKLKASKGKASKCGATCIKRTRTVGPFSFSLTVKVSGKTVSATAVVTLTRKSAQAGKKGKVCLSKFTPAIKQSCSSLTWKVGKVITLKSKMPTPKSVSNVGRPGFGVTARVGEITVGYETAIYLKSVGSRVLPDTNESACIATAHARAAC